MNLVLATAFLTIFFTIKGNSQCTFEVDCPSAVPIIIECASGLPVLPDAEAGFLALGGTVGTDIDCTYSFLVSDSDVAGEDCVEQMTRVRTFTIFDDVDGSGAPNDAEDVATCSVIYLSTDLIAPVIDGVGAGGGFPCDGVPVFSDPVTATDNCDAGPVIAFADTFSVGGCAGLGVTRTWTATDACGNESIASETWIPTDDVAPVISGVGPDGTFVCGDVPVFSIPVITDNCDTNPDIQVVEFETGNGCAGPDITTRWTVTDACGNETIARQVFTPTDTEAPVISGVGADGTHNCTDPAIFSTPTVSDNCDASPTLTFEDTPSVGGCAGPGVTRTWTATDACGNVAMATQTLDPTDTVAPVFDGTPLDSTYPCGELAEFPEPATIDNCTAVVIAFVDVIEGATCSGDNIITRTWTATDACGNFVETSQTLTPVDDTPPTLDVPEPQNEAYACLDDVPAAPVVTATDNCGAVTMEFVTDFMAPIDCDGENKIIFTRVWTFTDDCDNVLMVDQRIVVTALMIPTFTNSPLPQDIEVTCTAIPPKDVLMVESTCGDILPVVCVEEIIQSICPLETRIRTWEAMDCAGNTVTHTQTITVIDIVEPSIVCPPVLELECGDPTRVQIFNTWLASATGVDNCDTDLTITNDYDGQLFALDCANTDGIEIEFTAVDDCGNSDVCVSTVILVDNTAPVITNCPPDLMLDCSAPQNTFLVQQWLETFTAEDQCDTPILTNDYANILPGVDCAGGAPFAVTFTATDACGNVSECIANIIISDAVLPTIVCPTDLELECNDPNNASMVAEWLAAVTALDICGIASVVNDFGGILPLPDCGAGPIAVTFTATDVCGNESECIANIIMNDSRAPVIDCPDNTTIAITNSVDCEAVLVWSFPSALDQCDGAVVPTIVAGGPNIGDLVSPGIYEVCYTADDICLNQSICCFSVTVTEYKPAALACKNINVSLNENCEGIITPQMVLSGDNIGCPDNYVIEVWAPDGDNLGNIVDDQYLGQTLNYMICLPICNQCCWGDVYIEDKFAPVIDCPPVVTSVCNGIADILPPVAEDNCSEWEIDLINEVHDNYSCNPLYSGEVIRTYLATDASGATSTCVQSILLERVSLGTILFPLNTAVVCDSGFITNDEGYPDPSVSGYPTYNSTNLYPGTPDGFCNSFVGYTDQEISTIGCVTKIMRTWEIREWWCDEEFTYGDIQLIEIKDINGPEFTCPSDITMTTSNGCVGNVLLPAINAVDACSNIASYSIQYPGGNLDTNGGLASIPTGDNEVTYIVYDECYNSSSCIINVFVEDNTEPVAICDQNTVISIPHNGYVEVIAETFDDGSYDDCGIHSFEVRRMVDDYCNPTDTLFGPSVSFCCTDLGRDIMVALRVTDYNHNSNICMVRMQAQDKVDPSMVCPPDITISCTDAYDLDNLSFYFGDPEITDNCTTVPNVENVIPDINQCGIGTIIREFELEGANGLIISCQQNITIESDIPFNGQDIIWPDDLIVDGCTTGTFLPETLEQPYSIPVYFDNQCDLLGHRFEDSVFESVPGDESTCKKIIRHWKVINWCQQYDNGEYFTWSHDQTIRITNTQAPDISQCIDLVECNYDANCQPSFISLVNNATDDCTDAGLIDWTYRIDAFSDGTIDSVGFTNDASDDYPVGIHTIEWTATDGCGNYDVCEHVFEVRNCKTPTPICIQGLSVDLVPMDLDSDGVIDNEMAIIWASDFNASSSENCGNAVVFSVSQDTTDKSITYDCSHIGINTVELWVTDVVTGVQDYCETFIDVQDNNDIAFCNNGDNPLPRIGGHIYNEENEFIEDVEVGLTNLEGDYDMTDENGIYAFPSMPMGGNYVVDPHKDIHPLNGVSTLDIVLIQRHILSKAALESPYKMIAADINKDNKIDPIDLIELRKLIIGIYAEYPQNESWRFVDASTTFIDTQNPWTTDFNEDYSISNLSTDMSIDFVGVKVGDVNCDSNVNMFGTTENRNKKSIELKILNQRLGASASNSFDVFVNEDIELYGMQFTVNLSQMELESLQSDYFDITDANINKVDAYNYTVSIHDADLQKIEAGSAILTFTVNAIGTLDLSQNFSINSDKTIAEAYDGQLETNNISVRFGESLETILLYQNKPNPWKETTEIAFDLAENAEVTFNFYSTEGKLLMEKTNNYFVGRNAIVISAEDLGVQGVVFYEVLVGNVRVNKKMILLK